MSPYKLLLIGIGGAIGSIARYIIARLVDGRLNSLLPYGTLAVNVLGSFLLGMIYMLALRKAGLTENGRLFLGVGFCGGFTLYDVLGFCPGKLQFNAAKTGWDLRALHFGKRCSWNPRPGGRSLGKPISLSYLLNL
jgi:protein CrcB